MHPCPCHDQLGVAMVSIHCSLFFWWIVSTQLEVSVMVRVHWFHCLNGTSSAFSIQNHAAITKHISKPKDAKMPLMSTHVTKCGMHVQCGLWKQVCTFASQWSSNWAWLKITHQIIATRQSAISIIIEEHAEHVAMSSHICLTNCCDALQLQMMSCWCTWQTSDIKIVLIQLGEITEGSLSNNGSAWESSPSTVS